MTHIEFFRLSIWIKELHIRCVFVPKGGYKNWAKATKAGFNLNVVIIKGFMKEIRSIGQNHLIKIQENHGWFIGPLSTLIFF